MKTCIQATALSLLSLSTCSSAFVASSGPLTSHCCQPSLSSSQQQQPLHHQTSLNLVPGQGVQLVAASCNEYVAAEDEEQNQSRTVNQDEEETDSVTTPKRLSALAAIGSAVHSPNNAARTFLGRIFRGKSYQEPDLSEWNKFHSTNELIEEAAASEGDVVYFPICGFEWIALTIDGVKKYEVLPTEHNLHAACSLSRRRPLKEDVVGWFAPVCRLGLDGDDDQTYCNKHEEKELNKIEDSSSVYQTTL
jgi:hypothetical protein